MVFSISILPDSEHPNKFMEFLSTLVEKAPEKLILLTDEELTRRVKRVIILEAKAGMLQILPRKR